MGQVIQPVLIDCGLRNRNEGETLRLERQIREVRALAKLKNFFKII